jgi:hypothetical protein
VTDRKATAPRIPARTPAILKDPVRNRGVAFSVEERAALGLTGRLPSAVLTLDEQAERAYIQLRAAPAGVARKLYLEQRCPRPSTRRHRPSSAPTSAATHRPVSMRDDTRAVAGGRITGLHTDSYASAPRS